MGLPGVPATVVDGWTTTCEWASSPSPNTGSARKVTGRRFLVTVGGGTPATGSGGAGRPSSPTSVSRPFQILTPSWTTLVAQPRRGSSAGISVGDPMSVPSAGVPAGAVGEAGSTVLRDWLTNRTLTVTVTLLSPDRVISYLAVMEYDFAVAWPDAFSVL